MEGKTTRKAKGKSAGGAGREAERELTPLPRHQIASVASPHPRRSVSGGAVPLFSSRRGNVSRTEGGGGLQNEGKGSL